MTPDPHPASIEPGRSPTISTPDQVQARRFRSAALASMRHDLRTPVNAIIGYSELLLDDLDEGETRGLRGDLQAIQRGGQELLAIINEILDPSRVEAGQAAVETLGASVRHAVRTPLNHVVGYCEMLLEDAEAARREELSRDLRKIHLASSNLLTLLDEIVKIARAQPGSASEEAAPSAMITELVETIRPVGDDRFSAGADGGALLVVDDNEVNRDLLYRRLSRQGYTVSVAENGRQALQMIQDNPFDLVLLDVMMPEMNGYEVLQRLKSSEALRHIPVIMISALSEMDSVVRCISSGAEDYLQKPFDPVLLSARIGASLEKKRLRDREVVYLRQIEEEKKRADDLLHVILPAEIVYELKTHKVVKPQRYEDIAVLFCDIVGFTAYCETHPPEEVISYLQEQVELFERLTAGCNMEKIKTIGDSFMSAAGLVRTVNDPAVEAVRCGLQMVDGIKELRAEWDVRVGIHVGPAVAGVVGRRKYLFDLWGDTVNTAARVESHGADGAVNVSRAVWNRVASRCHGESLGLVRAKGKGMVEIFRVDGFRSPAETLLS
jgi:CheY-like chemotaxis protein